LRFAVAGRSADPFDRSMDMLVTRVRRKIEPDPRFLLTVPGVGYKLISRTKPAEARQYEAKPIEPERRQITALCCKLVGAMGHAVSYRTRGDHKTRGGCQNRPTRIAMAGRCRRGWRG